MTVTLVWLCDACEVATATKRADEPRALCTPNGWQVVRNAGGDYRHICPECLLKRVRQAEVDG